MKNSSITFNKFLLTIACLVMALSASSFSWPMEGQPGVGGGMNFKKDQTLTSEQLQRLQEQGRKEEQNEEKTSNPDISPWTKKSQ